MTDSPKPAITFNLERQREALQQRQSLLRAEFVEVELDLAITFCQIALSTGDGEKFERNENHAEQARETALRFLSTAEAPEQLQRQIVEKLAHLQALLDEVKKGPKSDGGRTL